MSTAVVTYEQYEELALRELDQFWELNAGALVRKPEAIMTAEHNRSEMRLAISLAVELDDVLFEVQVNNARTRRRSVSGYIPDVLVVPVALVRRNIAERRERLKAYEEPLPLFVEVWSPSTGRYDVNAKLPECQRRGDLEIWRVHPYERTPTAWRRQPDGSYSEALCTGGTIEPVALGGVVIDIDRLFAPCARNRMSPALRRSGAGC